MIKGRHSSFMVCFNCSPAPCHESVGESSVVNSMKVEWLFPAR